MKILTAALGMIMLTLCLVSCADETIIEDTVPKDFSLIHLRPDEIYIYNGGNPLGTRLDPLLNDSIKVEVNVSYSSPSSGTIKFIENEGWFYKPNDNFFGEDNFTYTVCQGTECQSTSIKLHVERPIDVNNCTYILAGETAETSKDQPVEIRIFANDIVCQFLGQSIYSPEKGTFNSYSYAGGYKNTVYVYYPPKGFVGTDSFKYTIFTNEGKLEATCTINIKP